MTDYSHYRRLNALPPLVRHWLECQYDGPIPLSAIEQAERNQAQMTAIDAQDQKIAGSGNRGRAEKSVRRARHPHLVAVKHWAGQDVFSHLVRQVPLQTARSNRRSNGARQCG